MSKNSIKLSEKHGVNPTLCQCFFCGESKYIALLGKLKGDKEAPKECIMDYEPCDKCQENMSQGVTLLEVSDQQPSDNRPPMKAQGGVDVYPLGRWCVVEEHSGFFKNIPQEVHKGDKLFVDSEIMDIILNVDNK